MSNQDAIWDYFQNRDPESFAGSEARLSYLAGILPCPGRVLNIGVGTGIFERCAIARGLTVFSLDPNQESIERIRGTYALGDRAMVGYSQNIPFSDSFFDAVVISEVLEHLTDDVIARTLSEIARVLRINGRIVGTVPARERLPDNAVVCPSCSHRFHRWGHMQSFDISRLHALLVSHFSDVRVWEKVFVTFSTLNWKGKAIGLARLLLHSLGVHGEQGNIVFVARRTDCR